MNTPVHVLVVEDNPADARLVAEALSESRTPTFDVEWADTIEAGVARLDDADVVLLDLGLPDASGLDALGRCHRCAPSVPIVVLTGSDDDAYIKAAIGAGAQDYLVKGRVELQALAVTLRYAIERQEMLRELEARVTERTTELATTADELARSNDRLQEFVHIVAHDLKNPLVAIGGIAELTRTAPQARSEAETNLALETITAAAEGAIAMIDDLLAYSQARSHIPPEPVCLEEQVKRAIVAVQPLLDRFAATVDVPTPLPTVIGHPVALHHVFRNLLANAATYHHPDRPPVITVTAESMSGGWRIIVADNGLGIPADKREAVFAPGVRLATDGRSGTGLGLAAVRTLIERHGGRITANPNPDGPGTRFVIELPPAGVP